MNDHSFMSLISQFVCLQFVNILMISRFLIGVESGICAWKFITYRNDKLVR